MPVAAQIAWYLGMIPGGIALYWAHKAWHYDDSPNIPTYRRKFWIWAIPFVAFWAIGVAIDMYAGEP
jgi:hypothetical protein